MSTMKEATSEFLAKKRIAVTGVSRTPGSHGSNAVYQRLRARGYTVFAINPNTDVVEGDPCYHDLKSVPGRRPLRQPCANASISVSGTCGCITAQGPAACRRPPPSTVANTASR